MRPTLYSGTMLGRSKVAGLLFVAGLAMCFLLPATAAAAALPAAPLGAPSASSSLAPVTIHFKPKDVTGSQGGTVTIVGVVKDKGSFAYTATGCTLWYRMGSSGSWTKAGVCLNSADFPITFDAHSKTTFKSTQKVSPTFPTGVYEWKIQLVGTYDGITEKSHTGMLEVTIT